MAGSRARDVVRRAVGALTVTALLGAAAAVATGLTLPGAAAPPEARTAESAGPSVVRTIPPAPSASPTPSDPGPAGEPGVRITARPAADGSFLISETITLPTVTTEVVLRPPALADAGAGFAGRRPAALELRVEAGGHAVPSVDGALRSPATVRFAAPSAQLRLSYRLTDVSVTSALAKSGRAVAAFSSLLDQMPADLPVMVAVTGGTVLSLTCPQLPLAEMACGAGAAPRFWTLQPVPFDRSRVLVQYDRPRR